MVEQVTVNHLVDGSNPPRGAMCPYPFIMSIYDISFELLDDSVLELNAFNNQCFIVANTASLCGFTNQYNDLEKLHQRLRIPIIATPCNDFGKQEPNSNKDIMCSIKKEFHVSFHVTTKVKIIDNPHPFYQWLYKNNGFLSYPRWNFYKYIIGKDGRLLAWFSPLVKPTDQRIINILNKLG